MTQRLLITGGTGILGQAFVSGFLNAGWDVCFTSRSSQKEVEARFPKWATDSRCHLLQVDLETHDALPVILEGLSRRAFFPTALINNARNVRHLKLDQRGRVARADFLGEFQLDVVVAYELALELSEAADSELKSIVNVSSIYGSVVANPALYEDFARQSPVQYGVAKAALNHLTRELAVRLAPKQIRVNSVSYGGVVGRADRAFMDRYARMCPSGRMLQPDEVLGPALFLAADASIGVNGHNLIVDGGWSIW